MIESEEKTHRFVPKFIPTQAELADAGLRLLLFALYSLYPLMVHVPPSTTKEPPPPFFHHGRLPPCCLILVSQASNALSAFICRDVDGVDYLVADFAVRCAAGPWRAHLPFFVVVLLVFPVGMPLFFFVCAYRRGLAADFLYRSYLPDKW